MSLSLDLDVPDNAAPDTVLISVSAIAVAGDRARRLDVVQFGLESPWGPRHPLRGQSAKRGQRDRGAPND